MRIWTVIFVVAALFNFAVGLPMLLAPEAMLAALGQPVPADLLMTRLASLLIVVLGIGYGMVARDPAANRPILWLGVLGKAPIPLLVWISGGAAALSSSAFILSLVDLAFATLFLLFLLGHRRPTVA
jgi:hypothetical protein